MHVHTVSAGKAHSDSFVCICLRSATLCDFRVGFDMQFRTNALWFVYTTVEKVRLFVVEKYLLEVCGIDASSPSRPSVPP